jgi:hypothetical protein
MTEKRPGLSGKSFIKDYTAAMVVAEIPSTNGETKQIKGECEAPRLAVQHQSYVRERYEAQGVKSFVAPCP